ncbi:MAG: hypothetical protein WBR14_22440 [Candidatus Acidiferrum sp.]
MRFVFFFWLIALLLTPGHLVAQAPAQKPAPKVPANPNSTQIPAQEPVPSPVSRHFPILIIAHGNDPSWSLRVGMKGPERLDRAGYPPIVLNPGDITSDESDNSWTFNAKDDDTGANVAIKLIRDSCSDNTPGAKYTFRVEVDHAQIGQLKGCGVSDPEKFPEFRKKNQLDMPDQADTDDKNADKTPEQIEQDKDKEYRKTVLEPITTYHSPTATAYLEASGRVVVSRGETRKVAAPAGSELALSRDGKLLLYTRSDSTTAPDRSIVLYELDTGRSRVVAGNNVRQPFWAPDDSHFAYLKFDGKVWQVWTAATSAPDNATLLAPLNIASLQGWVNPSTVLGTDMQNAYWLSADRPPQIVALKDIYGDRFQIMSSDTIRVSPINPDLLLVSAYYLNTPPGAPTDSAGLNQTFFLYELRSHRRTILGPPDLFTRNAEWSRDGLQIFFTRGVPGKTALVTDRMLWDGSGLRRYSTGNYLVVGR